MSAGDAVRGAGARFFHSPLAGWIFTNAWYSLVTLLDRHAEATVMNYGYAPADGGAIALSPALEGDRYALQLYHHVASGAAMRDRDVLEVGCGRGGGAAYVARAMAPRRLVGLDVNRAEIRFDRRHYAGVPNLAFVEGDAHAMPFAGGTFDVAINVESSHHYRDPARFLAEVHRVLRPGGTFLMACFPATDEASLRAAVRGSAFACVSVEDITAGVVRALDLDSARREDAVRRLAPRPLRTFAREFAGVRGSRLYDGFASGRVRYLNFVLAKAA